MVKKSSVAFCCFLILFVFTAHASEKTQIKVIWSDGKGYQVRPVDVKSFESSAVSIHLIDPNFKKDGLTKFTGLSVKQLLNHLKIDTVNGITIAGKDQYIGFLPFQDIEKDIALIAWSMNDKVISPLKGGPLKIVYPIEADVHGSCYIWYVDTIFIGDPDISYFKFTEKNNTKFIYGDALVKKSQVLDHKLFSIPPGCKNSIEMKEYGVGIQVVTLQSLLKEHATGTPGRISLVPYVGPRIVLDTNIQEYPIYIALSCGKKPIHYSLGGPFSVIFPVEKYRHLATVFPESGALFFLKEIIAE